MTQRICIGCGVQLPLRDPRGHEMVSAWVCSICGRQTVAVADEAARESLRPNVMPIPWCGRVEPVSEANDALLPQAKHVISSADQRH